MIIVADTSAFVAILQKEGDAGDFRSVILKAEKILISAATVVELHIVVTARLGEVGILKLWMLIGNKW